MKIYYADIRQLKNWEGRMAAEACLNKERIKKIQTSGREDAKLQRLAAGLLLEYGLRDVGLTGAAVSFRYGENGKPELLGCPGFYFNLTHSGFYAAAVFADSKVGIDMERLREGKAKIGKRFFSGEEQQYLEKHWSDELFTKFWTRKESYIKATGEGGRLPLSSFSVVAEEVHTGEDVPSRETFFLKSFEVEDKYWISVCAKGRMPDAIPEKIDLTKIDWQGNGGYYVR